MLGPNPRKAATPSTANSNPTSSGSDSSNTGDGLMVKAIVDIFNHVEASENPQEFRVSSNDQHKGWAKTNEDFSLWFKSFIFIRNLMPAACQVYAF